MLDFRYNLKLFSGAKGYGYLALLFILLSSCGGNPSSTDRKQPQDQKEPSAQRSNVVIAKPENHLKSGLVPANFYHHDIMISLKYATSDNFMHRVLYDTLKTAYLQVSAARKLGKVQSYLAELKPGYRLLVYDALRPQSVQFEMWNALDTIPVAERGKFVSNPVNGSVHNYAAAVDLTIIDETGNPLDMGAGYDDIRKIAYPELEAHFLSIGELTESQVENRKLLRKVMRSQGFSNIPTEWWHFNEFPRSVAKRKYQIVRTESI